jgi:hypothetical protein
MVAVILNDIDLKSQRRRGYRDHTQVYTNKGLYRVEAKYREPVTPASLPIAAATQNTRPEANRPEANRPEANRPEANRPEANRPEATRDDARRERPASTGSDIERLYDRYRD